MMDLFSILNGPMRRMSHVNRYSSIPVHRPENVAEHSWWVTMIAYLIADDLFLQGVNIKMELVLSKALVHDLSECVSGDIIRSYKYSSPEVRKTLGDADRINMQGITSKMGSVGPSVYHDWARAKADGLEGDIVAFADMVGVVIYCREEYLMGNRQIELVLKEMYETWFHKYHEVEHLSQYIDRMFPNGAYTDALQYADIRPRIMPSGDPLTRDHREGAISDTGPGHSARVPLS